MSKKLIVTYCILVFAFTVALKWFVVKDKESHAEPKPQIKVEAAEVMQAITITTMIEKAQPQPKKKMEKPPMAEQDNEQTKEAKAHKSESSDRTEDDNSPKKEKVIRVTDEHKAAGLKMLKGDRNVPLILLDFKKIGFSTYLSIMNDMGGRIFVGNGSSKRLLAEAVFYDNGKLSFAGFKEGSPDIEGLAIGRPREIVNEKIVETVLSSARRSFGSSDLRCVVILPVESEAAFIGRIAEGVTEAGFRIEDFSYFSGDYIIRSGPALLIREGTLKKDGKKVPINYTLVLA